MPGVSSLPWRQSTTVTPTTVGRFVCLISLTAWVSLAVQGLCQKIREQLSPVKDKYSDLQKLIPRDQYYRSVDLPTAVILSSKINI